MIRGKLVEYDAPDAAIINAPGAFTKESGQNIYKLTYRPVGSEWTLEYTLNLEKNVSDYTVDYTP